MQNVNDQDYLRDQQYKDSSNLNARAELHRRFSINQYGWMEWVWDQFDIPDGARILELGSGPGWLWHHYLDRVGDGWQIILSDFSPGMVEEQKTRLEKSNIAFTFRVIDAQDIPFEEATFDAVIANHMLYHVPDIDKALAEIYRVLKADGKLYAATNGDAHMMQLYNITTRFFPEQEGRINRSVSHRAFRLEDGGDKISKHFDHVEQHLYEDGLIVTDADAIVAYILSGFLPEEGVEQKQIDVMRDSLKQQIEDEGAINISKSTGMFIAEKAHE